MKTATMSVVLVFSRDRIDFPTQISLKKLSLDCQIEMGEKHQIFNSEVNFLQMKK